MELCSEGHEEVCYEGRTCPACEALLELSNEKNRVVELDSKIEQLEDIISELQDNIEEQMK